MLGNKSTPIKLAFVGVFKQSAHRTTPLSGLIAAVPVEYGKKQHSHGHVLFLVATFKYTFESILRFTNFGMSIFIKVKIMAKNAIRTSKKVATKASKLLRGGKTPKKMKSVAASDLKNRGK